MVANAAEMVKQPRGRGVREQGAVEEGRGGVCRSDCPGNGAVGADQGIGVVQPEWAQDAHCVGVAAAGGDDHFDACGFGRAQGGEVARADLAVEAEPKVRVTAPFELTSALA